MVTGVERERSRTHRFRYSSLQELSDARALYLLTLLGVGKESVQKLMTFIRKNILGGKSG